LNFSKPICKNINLTLKKNEHKMAPKKTQRSALWYYAQENMQKAKCTNMKDAIEALYVE
jgi:hypothetical protein